MRSQLAHDNVMGDSCDCCDWSESYWELLPSSLGSEKKGEISRAWREADSREIGALVAMVMRVFRFPGRSWVDATSCS